MPTTKQRETQLPFLRDPNAKINPRCPKCGRRFARLYFKPHAQKPSFECVCTIAPPGCGHKWTAK